MLIDFEFQETYLTNLADSMLLDFTPKSLPLATKTIPRDYCVHRIPIKPIITVSPSEHRFQILHCGGGGGQILLQRIAK